MDDSWPGFLAVPDVLGAVAAQLDLPSIAACACSSHALSQLAAAQQGWALKLSSCWPVACSDACDPRAAFKAAATAACQLTTRQPWHACCSRAYASEPPAAARMLITRPQHPQWQPPTLAASLDQHLLWAHAEPTAPATDSRRRGPQQPPAGAGDTDTAAAAAGVVEWLRSDPQHGHTAFVDALIELPAGGTIGYASASRDTTVKLWTPFAGGSRAGGVRPCRTLRGHSGAVSDLLLLPLSGSGGCGGGAALLASASADKTVRLWSLGGMAAAAAGTAAHSSAGSSASTGGIRRGGKAAAAAAAPQQGQQQGRGPLLATLHGHAGPVTSLLLLEPTGLLSCSRDCRLKLWDVASGSCAGTWKLDGPAIRLLGRVSSGAVALQGPSSLWLLDPRAPSTSSSSSSAGCVHVQRQLGSLACAAAHGQLLAAGGRRGAAVWDVRVLQSRGGSRGGSSISGGGSGGSPLFSGQLPGRTPVTSLSLERTKLVACGHRVGLHRAASIGVWRVPDGTPLTLLSSTLEPLQLLHASGEAGEAKWDQLFELMHDMRESDAASALALLHQQQPAGGGAHGPPPAAPAPAAQDGGGDDNDDDVRLQLSDGSAGSDDGGDGPHDSSSGGWGGSDSGAGPRSSCWGRVEPGVIALAASGPVIATVDVLGGVLLRDFWHGTPTPQQLARAGRSDSSARSVGPGGAVTAARATGAGASGSSARVDAQVAAAVHQLASKFW